MIDSVRENLSYFELYARNLTQKKIVKPEKTIYGEDKHNTHSFYTASCFVLRNDKTVNKLFRFIEEI